jgi:hypothetical protein
MSVVSMRGTQCDLLEDYPCAVVLAARLHVDSDHSAIFRHSEVDMFDPLRFGDTEDLYLQLLLQCPMTTHIACNRSVRCTLRIRTLGGRGASAHCRRNWR